MTTVVSFSGQFGGPEATKKVLPHFRALKAAAAGRTLDGFPFPEYAMILRVDGEVRQFGVTDVRHVDFDRKGTYVSIDIGITREELAEGGPASAIPSLVRRIVGTASLLRETKDRRLDGVDWLKVESWLRDLAAAYEILITLN